MKVFSSCFCYYKLVSFTLTLCLCNALKLDTKSASGLKIVHCSYGNVVLSNNQNVELIISKTENSILVFYAFANTVSKTNKIQILFFLALCISISYQLEQSM